MAGQQDDPEDIYLTLNRVINAPVETVYAAWTDPEVLRLGRPPAAASARGGVAALVVGGTFLVEMRGVDGRRFVTRGVYREIVPNRRLVYTWRWEGSDVESLVTVEFEPESSGTTRLTLTHSLFTQEQDRDEHERGWTGCLAKLEEMWAG